MGSVLKFSSASCSPWLHLPHGLSLSGLEKKKIVMKCFSRDDQFQMFYISKTLLSFRRKYFHFTKIIGDRRDGEEFEIAVALIRKIVMISNQRTVDNFD